MNRLAVLEKHLIISNIDLEPIKTSESKNVVKETVARQPPQKQTISAQDFSKSVGKELGTSGWLKITQERVNLFADVTLDAQWIHVDPERATKESPFGFLTLSMLSFLVGESLPNIEGVKMGVNYGFNKVRFIAPVKVGDEIRTKVILKEATEIAGGIQSIYEVTFEVKGAKPACVCQWITRMYL